MLEHTRKCVRQPILWLVILIKDVSQLLVTLFKSLHSSKQNRVQLCGYRTNSRQFLPKFPVSLLSFLPTERN